MSLAPFCSKIRATQDTPSTPAKPANVKAQAAQIAATAMEKHLTQQERTQAIKNLGIATSLLLAATSSASIVTPGPYLFVLDVALMTSHIQTRLQSGAPVDWARGDGLALPIFYSTVQAKGHLTAALSELYISGKLEGRAAIPLLNGLLRATVRLERLARGDWRTAAALHWAREISLYGVPVRVTAQIRNGQLTLGWASRFYAKLDNVRRGAGG